MDPFVTLASRFVDGHRGLGHSALPDAPQLPTDERRPRRRRGLETWRRLFARGPDRLRRRPVRPRPTTRLPVRSAHMAQGE
jgi:hypothetical protein